MLVREPRAFIQLKRYKRCDGPIMWVWGPESTIRVAAGPQPVRLAWGPQIWVPKMRLFSLKGTRKKLLDIIPNGVPIMKITMTAILSCTGPQTVAPKGPAHRRLFSRRGTWIFFFAWVLVYIGVTKNNTDSNFILYMGPDSSPKGPESP